MKRFTLRIFITQEQAEELASTVGTILKMPGRAGLGDVENYLSAHVMELVQKGSGHVRKPLADAKEEKKS